MNLTKLGIIVLAIIIVSLAVTALDYFGIVNPYTGQLDLIRSSNYSGENITADYFIGNGSRLTSLNVTDTTIGNCSVSGSCSQLAYNDTNVYFKNVTIDTSVKDANSDKSLVFRGGNLVYG